MYQDYILLVDSGRPRRGNTAGRYRVSAKNKKQAVELLRTTESKIPGASRRADQPAAATGDHRSDPGSEPPGGRKTSP